VKTWVSLKKEKELKVFEKDKPQEKVKYQLIHLAV